MEFNQIITDIKNQVFHPVYFLMGDEPYYIDQISDYIAANVLKTPEEREFNLSVLYGRDVDESSIIVQAKSFSMFANYQVIIVKEAQNLKQIELLKTYIDNPQKSTILVICYKYATIDRRTSFGKGLPKNAIVFESKKIYDDKIPAWLSSHAKTLGFSIRPDAAMLMSENIGNDLSRLANELQKLSIVLPKGTTISVEDIERNIGISKDFNVFELQKALGTKNVLKANRITNYFVKNPKNYPTLMVIPILYSYFVKVLIIHAMGPQKDNKSIAAALGVNPYFLNDYLTASRNYSITKLEKIFSYLREADNRTKGIEYNPGDDGLYKELIFKILH